MSVISLKDVSKCYLVYESPLKALTRMLAPKMVVPEEVWALKDINLEVNKAECLGIIGNNGSGKSTLLAVIGGIISPTSGAVRTVGRISTLLDLTVGMQKELSGLENVYILAGLLGLSNAQTKERLETIVEFAELDRAIFRPVKTYSTGMQMRLGFSVALHVDFDILVVDEVLAVGDSNFHRKCINRMRHFHLTEKKTIIIASHGLGEIASLTTRLLLLDHGSVLRQGHTEEVLRAYWQECERERNRVGHRISPLKPVNPYGDDTGEVKIAAVRFLDHLGTEQKQFNTNDAITLEMWFNAIKPVENPLFRVQIFRNDGVWVHGINTYRHDCDLGRLSGRGCLRLHYDHLNLLEGDYYVSVSIWPDEYTSFISDVAYDYHEMGYVLRVISSRHHGAGIVFQPASFTLLPPDSEDTQNLARSLEEDGVFSRGVPKPQELVSRPDQQSKPGEGDEPPRKGPPPAVQEQG